MTNILSFALKTAEQNISEINPDLVTKLVDGRNKRFKELEKESLKRNKDVDQRSAETCAVSAVHLENFKTKALDKLKVAEEDYLKVFNILSELLSDKGNE